MFIVNLKLVKVLKVDLRQPPLQINCNKPPSKPKLISRVGFLVWIPYNYKKEIKSWSKSMSNVKNYVEDNVLVSTFYPNR